MVARSRSQTTAGPSGRHSSHLPSLPPSWNDRVSTKSVESCDDEVKPGNNGALVIDKYSYNLGEPPVVSAVYTRNGYVQEFETYPVSNINVVSWGMAHLSTPGGPTAASATARLLRDTNPSRPLIDVPVFAAELRDIPNLLLKRTSDTARDIANGRLSFEYGWKPLIKDIQNVLDFQNQLEKRVKELKALRTSGLRRKRRIWSGSAIDEWDANLMNISGMSIYAKRNKVTTSTLSGFVKWVPSGLPQTLLGLASDDSEEIYAQAAQAMTGISNTIVDPSSIWEAIPYSWLFDWCSNTGDFLAASRNVVAAVPTKVCLMRHTKTIETCRLRSGFDVGYDLATKNNEYFVRLHETKTRDPSSLTLSAHLPFLSERQVTILADITRSNYKYRR